jgi:hypothetical protein
VEIEFSIYLDKGGLRMFTYIILLWILINMSAPAWTYALLGIATFITILNWGIKLANKSK